MNKEDRQPPAAPKPRDPSASRKKSASAAKGTLDANVRHRIGYQLKAIYSDVVNEGVPNRFEEIIARLDESN